MQVMVRQSNEWVRCGRCSHKLFKITDANTVLPAHIQIKCHSCKAMNTTDADEADYNTIDGEEE